MPKRTCLSCRHWKNSPKAGSGRIGMCSKPELSSGFTGWQQTEASDTCDDWGEMAYFQGNDGALHVDRRISARTTADYPARLQTTAGDWSGRLADISATGARLQVGNPPKAGVHALLKCGANEIFCRIAWSTGDACGLAFDRPVSSSLLFEVSGRASEPAQNTVDVSKIPAGTKRERLRPSSLDQTRFDSPGEAGAAPENIVSLDERRAKQTAPAERSFESRDEAGYIKFYPFRAMANP